MRWPSPWVIPGFRAISHATTGETSSGSQAAGLTPANYVAFRDSSETLSRLITTVPPEGFEPPTYGTGNRRSIP